MRLSGCREGDRVVVRHVRGAGALRNRLLEMGLISGARISIVKYAPLRDPMELVLGDAHVSLRVMEAAEIEVEVEKNR
jgi:Fe2+ transport system protein FeoA